MVFPSRQCSHSDGLTASAHMTPESTNDSHSQTEPWLKSSLTDIGDMIEGLSQRRLSLARQFNTLSPILNLPQELISEIMLATFPENSWNTWGSDTPLLFGSICSLWRKFAWSIPRLWRTISLHTKYYSESNTLILRDWIDRSGFLPLSLHFRLHHPMVSLPDHGGALVGRPPLDPEVIKLLGLIAGCSQRWQDVYLDLFIYPRDFFNVFPTSFPLLRTMTLSTARASRRLGSSSSRVPWEAPLLRVLSIHRHIMGYLDLPLNRVVHFSLISNVEPGECLDALRLLDCLENCVFASVTSRLRPITYTAVTSHSLTYLGVEFNPIRASLALPALFDHLICPSLQVLCLRIGPAGIFMYTNLISFISRSACSLVRLSLSGVKVSGAEFAECLATTPSLIDLTLEEMELPADTLRRLSVHPGSATVLLPNLQNFTYKGPSQLDPSDLVVMASSRRCTHLARSDGVDERITGLRYILIDVREAPGDVEINSLIALELARLRSEGMRIELLIPPP